MAPDGAAAVWDALLERGVKPAGLGARDTLRLEVCFHLYGNDLSEDRNPIEAGPGLVLQARHGLHRRRCAARPCERPAEKLVPFAFTGPGIPRQGNPVEPPHGAGVVTSGTLSPCLEIGIGMAYVPVERAPSRARRSRSTCAASCAPAEVRKRPLYRKEQQWPRRAIPTDLQVPPRARLGAHRRRQATFGITWYAQDAARRGRVLRPAGGRRARSAKDQPTPRSSR